MSWVKGLLYTCLPHRSVSGPCIDNQASTVSGPPTYHEAIGPSHFLKTQGVITPEHQREHEHTGCGSLLGFEMRCWIMVRARIGRELEPKSWPGLGELRIRDLEQSLKTSPMLVDELMSMACQLNTGTSFPRAVSGNAGAMCAGGGAGWDVSDRSSPKLIRMVISLPMVSMYRR